MTDSERLYDMLLSQQSKNLVVGISLLFPLLLSADTIKVKTCAPQNQQAVFQYRAPLSYNPRKTCRVLVIFGGRNTDGKADASGRMGRGD